jgi:Uma2 family endonuclease
LKGETHRRDDPMMSEGASMVENMTAQALPARSLWTPDPVRQRLANYTTEDVLALPDDAPRVELRDGVLIVVPSPTIGHQKISALLWMWLHHNAPPEYEPSLGVGIAIDIKNTREPDVILLRRPVVMEHHFLTRGEFVLAVEVVSPGTRRRDRFEKPGEYARAGVPHFWRIEQNPTHIYAYALGRDGQYRLVADSDKELILDSPFEIRLPIRDITP